MFIQKEHGINSIISKKIIPRNNNLFKVIFIVVYSHILRTHNHPPDRAIATKFYLSIRHYAINLIKFTITPVNFNLPLDFYDGASRNLLKIRFLLASAINLSSTESQLITANMLKGTFYFVKESKLPLQISENSEADLGSMPHLECNSCTCSNS